MKHAWKVSFWKMIGYGKENIIPEIKKERHPGIREPHRWTEQRDKMPPTLNSLSLADLIFPSWSS